jgi:hypothetical protein
VSLIYIAAARSRFPAWLALLAISLLFIAPVISKSLMARHGYSSAMMMPMSAAAHTAGNHHLAAVPSAPAEGDHQHLPAADADTTSAAVWPPPFPHSSHLKHHHMSLMDDSACGYCVLLIHLSLDSVQLPRLWTLLQAATPAVPFALPTRIVCWIPIWFRPRGPPVNALYPA